MDRINFGTRIIIQQKSSIRKSKKSQPNDLFHARR
jgi:hypothetical protein